MTKKTVAYCRKIRKKKNPASRPVIRLGQGLFWGGIAALSGTFGLLSAFLLAATPLKNQLHLGWSQHSDGLGSIIPVTLTRPINVLILGIDNSDHPHKDHFTREEALGGNSDTMLLVRLVPNTHQVNILSIPRDTLVEIPGIGIDKINDANVKGGVELAEKTVSRLLSDLRIDYYVRLDTEGFGQLVDALGGVEVNVPKSMHYTDQTQKLFINFEAGQQRLNGEHLQEYVRFRHDELGDIGRVQRQQEVLKAILHSLWQTSTLGRLPKLLQVVKDNVDTDLSVGAILGVAQFLASGHQSPNLVMLPGRFSGKDEYPLSYWIENPDAAAPILARYFDVRTGVGGAIANSTDSRKFWQIAVFNATGESGEAVKTMSVLRNQGFDNTYITDQEIDAVTIPLSETQIIAQQGNLEAAEAVKNALGLGQVQIASTGDLESDVTVVMGTDLAKRVESNVRSQE